MATLRIKLAPMDETMGQRLKSARIAVGIESARAAAKRFGWTLSTYAAHENGQNNFDAEVANAYAKAYRVSAAWLLTGEGYRAPSAPSAPSELETEDSSATDIPHIPALHETPRPQIAREAILAGIDVTFLTHLGRRATDSEREMLAKRSLELLGGRLVLARHHRQVEERTLSKAQDRKGGTTTESGSGQNQA